MGNTDWSQGEGGSRKQGAWFILEADKPTEETLLKEEFQKYFA